MFSNPLNVGLIVTLLAVCQPQACNTQFLPPPPFPGSLSKASSTATQRELQLGRLGLSRGVVSSQTVTQNDGGYGSGGSTSIAKSKSRTGQLNLGRLGIGSTLTASKTQTNGAVSRGLSHNLNVGRLGIGSSLSRDNLQHGFGLKQSQTGGVKLGLGLLNIDLSRNKQPQNSQALTQAQAQAQGQGAFAKANSNANTVSKQFGGLGFKKTESQSNAVSGAKYGQSTAGATGLVGGRRGNLRTRRSMKHTQPGKYVRNKRQAQFIPFAYPDSEFYPLGRQFGLANFDYQQVNYGFDFPQKRSTNAQGLANSRDDLFEQQAAANTQSNHKAHENGIFGNNAAASIGSNLALDGNSGQLSSANVNQDNSLMTAGSQNSNNAQSQALNFKQNQQQAANANAGTKQLQTESGQRTEAHGVSQATENNKYGSSSNTANTNSQVYEDGNTHGSQADSSSQSILQGKSGKNSAAQTNVNVNSLRGADGSVTNSATSHAAAVGRGGQSANAVASASSSSSNSNVNGNSAFGNAISNTDSSGHSKGFGGAQAKSGAFGNLNGARGFANGRTARRG